MADGTISWILDLILYVKNWCQKQNRDIQIEMAQTRKRNYSDICRWIADWNAPFDHLIFGSLPLQARAFARSLKQRWITSGERSHDERNGLIDGVIDRPLKLLQIFWSRCSSSCFFDYPFLMCEEVNIPLILSTKVIDWGTNNSIISGVRETMTCQFLNHGFNAFSAVSFWHCYTVAVGHCPWQTGGICTRSAHTGLHMGVRRRVRNGNATCFKGSQRQIHAPDWAVTWNTQM